MKVLLPVTLCAVGILFLDSAFALTSLCPTIFQYKTTTLSAAEYQSWSGVLHLQSSSQPSNVDIILDRTVTHISAHHYDVVTSDWKKFNLTPRNQTSVYYQSQSELSRVHLTVEFNSQSVVPQIEEIRINGVRVCPSSYSTQSGVRQPTNRPTESSLYYPNNNRGQDDQRRSTTERINSLDANRRRIEEEAAIQSENDRRRRVNNNNNGEQSTSSTTSSFNREPGPGSIYTSSTLSTTRRPTQSTWTYSNRPAATTTTTSSPYFPGDLHMLFESNANERRRTTESPISEPCGTLSPVLNPLVVNGEAANDGQFPWHAALYISQGVQLKYTCGGNLISKRIVLTAAHCVTLKRSANPINPEHLLIYLGKSDLLHWQGHEQDFSVDEVIIHPQYNHSRYYNDLAILKLKKNIRYTEYVRPVCLWSSQDLKAVVGRVGRVPGWGYNENGVVGTKLSYVEMPIVTHESCIWSNRDVFSRITSDTSFCAGFRNGSNVCNGDSGGGMVLSQSGRWYLKGIVSVSVAIQNHFLCDPDHYVVFGDVSKFQSWLDGYVG